LRKGDKRGTQLQRAAELLDPNCSSKHRRNPLGSAEQVDILTNEPGIDGCVEASILDRDILHSLAVGDIDEVEGSLSNEILRPVWAQRHRPLLRRRRSPCRGANKAPYARRWDD
jgi:hypothetical protein